MKLLFQALVAIPQVLKLLLEMFRAWKEVKEQAAIRDAVEKIKNNDAQTNDMETSFGSSGPDDPSGLGKLRPKKKD